MRDWGEKVRGRWEESEIEVEEGKREMKREGEK